MKQFEMFELSFQGEERKENWASVDLTAIFTDASGSKEVKGFYAGEGTYKVRFLPEIPGQVSWEVKGVISAKGQENCEPADKDNHGIVHAEGTYLKNADGSWFFSFGTTIYALAHQDKELTEQTFETLAQNPFNKVRMCVFPKHYDYNVNDPEYFPFELKKGLTYIYEKGQTFNSDAFNYKKAEYWDVTRPNFKFWGAFEEKLARLDRLGIQCDLILFHPYDRWGFSHLTQEENLIYLDYLLARLSAFPNIWWSMANEYDLCGAKTIEDWKEISKFIAKNDPYKHLLSNHNCFPAYDFSDEEITHCSLQKRVMDLVPEYAQQYGKPVLYDECAYEGNLKQGWGSISGAEMTNRFWKVTTSGGYCTHGEVFLDADMENIDDAVLWWAKGGKLVGQSPKRIAFLRQIIEEIGKPLDYYNAGLFPLLSNATNDQIKEIMKYIPEEFHGLFNNMLRMDYTERVRMRDQEFMYAGHADEDAYIFYMGTDCFGRFDINLSENHTYKVEVIDAWNMTRETVMTGVKGTVEVKLPGREYMAILATAEN